jgi:uncharacterized membrane-anchored protein
MKQLQIALAPAVLAATAALAAEPSPRPLTPAQKAYVARVNALLEAEHPQRGDIHIPEAKVTLHLGDKFYFLGAEDARKAIVDGWGDPADTAEGVLGMIVPTGRVFANSWGAVVTYEDTGYVSDKDAKSADYDALLDELREGEDEVNQKRAKDGFRTIHLVGWAQPPTYDPVSHSEVWARRLRFSGERVDSLNYEMRMLGRQGVLSLTLVSDMNELAPTRDAANALAKTATFDAGARYADFQDGDEKAAYGVGGLVAAGLGVAAAQKLGLIALLLLFAKKGAVLLVAGFGWLAARFRRALGLKAKKPAPAPLQLEAEAAPETTGPEESV